MHTLRPKRTPPKNFHIHISSQKHTQMQHNLLLFLSQLESDDNNASVLHKSRTVTLTLPLRGILKDYVVGAMSYFFYNSVNLLYRTAEKMQVTIYAKSSSVELCWDFFVLQLFMLLLFYFTLYIFYYLSLPLPYEKLHRHLILWCRDFFPPPHFFIATFLKSLNYTRQIQLQQHGCKIF